MASIYIRGEVLWIKFKNAAGKYECRSSGYRKGHEALARELAAEAERQAAVEREGAHMAASVAARARTRGATPGRAAAPTPSPRPAAAVPAPVGPAALAGALTVRAYGTTWIARRTVANVKTEAAQLRLHIYPLIGDMAIADVRPRHIRDVVAALRAKTSDHPKCKGDRLAPRTVRHIFALLRRFFKSAVIDEHIATSPVMVEKNVLPKNVDKDPEWRSTAIFEREELITIISDPRIPEYRRVLYALEGIAGIRHGEMAGVRWREYHDQAAPLGKLVVTRSGEKKRTKTQLTREIPVHSTLARILGAWKATGWADKYGRDPRPDDLIVPTEKHKVRKSPNTLRDFKKDLALVGLRPRRAHDLRRTFITLAQIDGARRDILKPLTHPSERDIVGLYTTFPWPVVCGEVAKLRVALPDDTSPVAARPNGANNANGEIIPFPAPVVAGYSPSYNPECRPEKREQFAQVASNCQPGPSTS